MPDTFDGIPIEDQAGNRVDLAYLRTRFGRFLSASWDRSRWTLDKIYLPEGAMTCWVNVQTAEGAPLAGFPVTWGWPDGAVATQTDDAGRANWVIGNSIWIDGAGNDAQHSKGPYFADADGFHVEGVGWAGGTNHMKPCFYFRKAGGSTSNPPTGGGSTVDTAFVESRLKAIEQAVSDIRTAIQ